MESVNVIKEYQVSRRLLELTEKTKYELIQENGQRRLTSPDLTTELKDRMKGSEIFLGRLPRDCYEDEIMPFLQKAGRLLELRLMLDFSGSTRGYAFALFENAGVARHACRILDGSEIRPGHKIGVVKSIDNCRLFFGGVPKDKKKEDFVEELGKLLDGIVDIYLYPNAQDRTQNRGFIFVEFKDHRSAAMARRQLIPGKVVLWNHEIAVDWADPEPGEPVDADVMESVTALFVRNLPVDTPHQQIREIFQRATGVSIVKLKKINHFAFIHYENRQLAQYVLDVMMHPNGIAEKLQWEIRWAKPIDSSKSIDREISLNEAVTNTHDMKERACAQRSNRRKRSNKIGRENRPTPASIVHVNYQQLLASFIFENFNADCYFELYPIYEQNGYICKITAATKNGILFAFEGRIDHTKENAVESTSRHVYFHVRHWMENQQRLMHCHEPYDSSSPNTSSILEHEVDR